MAMATLSFSSAPSSLAPFPSSSSARLSSPPSYLHFSSPTLSSSHLTTSAFAIQDLFSSRTGGPADSSDRSDSFGSSLFGSFGEVQTSSEPKPSMECPPGLAHYETMAVLRPDISEEQRLALTQRYEEAIIASGGMGVEVFNRGMMPLAYNIRKKDMQGIANRYLDGIYFLFTYFAKPEALAELQAKFNTDDDIIRSSTFKIKPVRSG